MTKPWRQDQEALSAAFSKWVRVAMVYDDDTDGACARTLKLEESQRLLDQGRQELESMRTRLRESEELLTHKGNILEAEEKDIKVQRDALHLAEAKLSSDMADLQSKKESFEVECAEKTKQLDLERLKLDKDRATLAQLDKYLMQKEKKLNDSSSSTATESTNNHASRAVEKSLHDERKWIDEAAVAISEREDELERKESALRKSQASIRTQEERLAEKLAELQKAQARVRSMAEHLQKSQVSLEEKEKRITSELVESQFFARVRTMAESLQNEKEQVAGERKLLQDRFQECDECERHLSKWQQELDSTAALRK
jgi:chromosome segregation ATPase